MIIFLTALQETTQSTDHQCPQHPNTSHTSKYEVGDLHDKYKVVSFYPEKFLGTLKVWNRENSL